MLPMLMRQAIIPLKMFVECRKIFVSASKKKIRVFIIDEAHMLSNSTFNAMLKTLEEPPKHVFILATTDPSRLPRTTCQGVSASIFKE